MPARKTLSKNDDKVHARTKSRLLFLRQFLSRPTEVASVMPSSPQLVAGLVAGVPAMKLKTVLEYGPGTGAITEKLLDALPEGSRYLAAEPNPEFRQHLAEQGLEIEIIPDYAQNIVERVLREAGEVDLIVSGLPFSVMPPEVLQSIIESTHQMLRSGGEFRQFIYTHTLMMPKMRDMLATLRRKFSRVETSIIFRNLPPATIIRCVK